MKILFVSSIFPEALHPARGTFNYETCRALQRAGAEVKVVAPQAWTEMVRSRRSGKSITATAAMQQHQLEAVYPTYWYPPKILRSYYGEFFWRSMRKTARKTVQNWTPDFILSYWAHPDGYAGLQLAKELKVPCAVIVGGSDVLVLSKNARRRAQVLRVLKESDAVFTVSQGLADNVELLGVPRPRIHTIYQGVDTARFYPEDQVVARHQLGIAAGRPLFVWVGRLVSIKNLDLLITVAEIKAQRGEQFALCLLGEGPLRPSLEKTIREKKLDNHVFLIGAVGHDKLPLWYQAADITLLSSHSEGLPNILRESLACGTPFISTNVGSISEIADPQYSILVPPGDSTAFVKAIDLMRHGPYQQRVETAIPRTWNQMATEILEVVKTLQKNSQSTPAPGLDHIS